MTTAAEQVASESAAKTASTLALKEWPLWEVFVRSKQGLEHKHLPQRPFFQRRCRCRLSCRFRCNLRRSGGHAASFIVRACCLAE